LLPQRCAPRRAGRVHEHDQGSWRNDATRPSISSRRPFDAQDPYARSKADAERALVVACSGTGTAAIVVRLPLVYGPGVKGNFLVLLDAVGRRAPLPIGAIQNRRDLLYVGNLVHAIVGLLDCNEPPIGAVAGRRRRGAVDPRPCAADRIRTRRRAENVFHSAAAIQTRCDLAGRASIVPRLAGIARGSTHRR
jgi:hypothetical protein